MNIMLNISPQVFFPVVDLLIVITLSSCSIMGKIENQPLTQVSKASQGYRLDEYINTHASGESVIFLAFSGGGTRAAAFSYGVLKALRDTVYPENGKTLRLLDEVDRISGVSGGSFTAAYYGLFGEQLFKDYKDVFLYRDVQGDLTNRLFSFSTLTDRLFGSRSYTEKAIDYYDRTIFQGKTFADLQQSEGPFIFINATDLTTESQFVFDQLQFDFLCSDLSSFKIARAVAASSAVPVIFEPILIENFPGCAFTRPQWLSDAETRARETEDERLADAVRAMNEHLDKSNPPYLTLVDGGIVDNLGLRNLYREVQFRADRKELFDRLQEQHKIKRLVIILVNAKTIKENSIGISRELPSIATIVKATTNIPLRLFSTETSALLEQKLHEWAAEASTKEYPVTPYFIELSFRDIEEPAEQQYFNSMPTSFVLEQEQVDRLIELPARLLKQNEAYQRLLNDLGVKPAVN